MSLEVINGQGGWLAQVREPNAVGQLGGLRTGADAMRTAGVPVESALLPALEQLSPEEAADGPVQIRDDFGKSA